MKPSSRAKPAGTTLRDLATWKAGVRMPEGKMLLGFIEPLDGQERQKNIMKTINALLVGLVFAMGCGGELDEGFDEESELAQQSEELLVPARASDGTVAQQLMGAKAVSLRLDMCDTSTCGTGSSAIVFPRLNETPGFPTGITNRSFSIGVGGSGTPQALITNHATSFCNQLPSVLPQYSCVVQQGCQSSAPSVGMHVCLNDGAPRTASSTRTRASDWGSIACQDNVANRTATFGGKTFDVKACRLYGSTIPVTSINALTSVTAGQKIALRQIVVDAMLSSIMFGLNPTSLATGVYSNANLLPSPLPCSAPALKLGNPLKCLAAKAIYGGSSTSIAVTDTGC
jgi:hypothetical protein